MQRCKKDTGRHSYKYQNAFLNSPLAGGLKSDLAFRFDRGETTTMTLERDGLFDVSVHKILVEADLQPETIFQCLLAIPGTSFSAKADSMYLKGHGLISHSN